MLTLVACGEFAEPTINEKAPIIYGADDRQNYFEVAASGQKEIGAGTMVALVSNRVLQMTRGDLASAPSWGVVDNLCDSERFANEPSAAFCSGVLVDWDLVLTAGHCARAFAVEDFSVVFDFYYEAPGVLAYRPDSVAAVAEIVAERDDEAGSTPRLDYAWLRLKAPVSPLRRPAPVHTGASSLAVGDPIVAMSHGGGIPLKIDSGARVRDARADSSDYFAADADDFGGSSGGAAFDDSLILTGVISRGQEDFAVTESGCRQAIVASESEPSQFEEITFADQAVAGLCEMAPNASSICRQDCGDPCQALPHPASEGGCSLLPDRRSPQQSELGLVAVLSAATLRRRRQPRARRTAGWPG